MRCLATSRSHVADPLAHSFGYNIAGAGRWISLPLKKKKKAGGKKRKPRAVESAPADREDEDMPDGSDGEGDDEDAKPWEVAQQAKESMVLDQEADDPDDPEKSIPFARYNTMLAVQRSTLYMCVLDRLCLRYVS